jgi:hypothetical protein
MRQLSIACIIGSERQRDDEHPLLHTGYRLMKTGNREFSSPLYRVLEDTRAVYPEDAMLDLCSMTIGLPNVAGTEGQTLERLKSLSSLKSDGPGSTKLFGKRTLQKWRSFHALQVVGDQQGEGMKFPHPTFSGLLTANRDTVPTKDTSALTSWELLFNVQVSINRAVQAQTVVLDQETFEVRRSQPYALFLSETAARQVTERLLVPKTNILDRTEPRQRYAASKPAEEHLREFVLELTTKCAAALGQMKPVVPTVTVGALEVCWDFYDEQPVIMVELIKAKAMRIAKKLRAKYSPTATVTEGQEIDSPSVIIDLIEDLAVRFYAKSVQTIRFEVTYGPERMQPFKTCEGLPTLNDAVEMARSARLDAAHHMNTILALMRQETDESDATPAELIRAVMAAFPNVFEARTILACLANHSRIRTFPKDPRLPGLRQLKKQSVLECDPASPGKRNYVVTPRFEDARRQLMFTQAIPRRFWIKPRPRHLRVVEKW